MTNMGLQFIICAIGGVGFGALNSIWFKLDWPMFLVALTAYSIVQSVTVAFLLAEKVPS